MTENKLNVVKAKFDQNVDARQSDERMDMPESSICNLARN